MKKSEAEVSGRITSFLKKTRMNFRVFIHLVFLFPLITLGQGQIKFNSLEYHVSNAIFGQTTYLKIPFSNIGNEPILITKCQSTNATSMISSTNKAILPNQSDTLTVTILNRSMGDFKYSFLVSVNNQEFVHVLKVNVKVLDIKVYGKVVNRNSGEPLPFVTVRIDKKDMGTSTDFDGEYSLKASVNDTLIFSLAGMKTRKLKVEKEVLNVELEEVAFEENVGPPMFPKTRRPEETTSVTKVEIENATNPKYNFRQNAEKNRFIIFVSELNSTDLSSDDLDFQQKYNVKYVHIDGYAIDYLTEYNLLTFKYLNKKYNKTWRNKIRKDAVGLIKE